MDCQMRRLLGSKYLESQLVCVDKPRTKTCLGLVLDIAQSFTGQNSRMYKLQEIESIFYEARPIKG